MKFPLCIPLCVCVFVRAHNGGWSGKESPIESIRVMQFCFGWRLGRLRGGNASAWGLATHLRQVIGDVSQVNLGADLSELAFAAWWWTAVHEQQQLMNTNHKDNANSSNSKTNNPHDVGICLLHTTLVFGWIVKPSTSSTSVVHHLWTKPFEAIYIICVSRRTHPVFFDDH